MKRRIFKIALALTLSGLLAPAAVAKPWPGRHAQRPIMVAKKKPKQKKEKKKQQKLISAGQAAAIARKQYGGKVLSVKLKKAKSKNPYYRVKLLKDGRVRNVRISALAR